MRLSIVIVTYNSFPLIFDCLKSIFDNNDIGKDLDVIIADNASGDQQKMFELITRKFGNKNVFIYDTKENGGYGKGNNFGFAKTESEIVIVMNPDVRIVEPVFGKILKEFRNPNIGMAGVSFVDGSLPYYYKPESSNFLTSLFLKCLVKFKKYDPIRMYLSGSFLIFNKEAFMNAGAFDENIFMYYEEPDITNRILAIGKEIKWLKDIKCLHLAHGRTYNHKLYSIQLQSFEYYCKKYNLSVKQGYKHSIELLRVKSFFSFCLRDFHRMELYKNQLYTLRERIKYI